MKEQIKNLSIYQAGKTPEELQSSYHLDVEMLKLSSNENVYGPSPKVKEALEMSIRDLHEYPDSSGRQLKKKLADHYDIPEEAILLGAGLDEVIMMISRAVLNKGDEILTSENTFVQYMHHATIESSKIVTVPLEANRFDLSSIAEHITNHTALIWLCNPNNPTGGYFSEEELIHLLDQAGEIPVVLDEAYAEYVTAENYPDSFKLRNKYPNLIILRTFSKAYGLASMRIGYAVSSDELTDLWHRVKLPFNVTTLSLAAAEAALEDQEYLLNSCEKNAEERARFYRTSFKEHLMDSETNFILVKSNNVTELNEHLLKEGIIARPTPLGVRVTIGTHEMNNRVISSLEKYFA